MRFFGLLFACVLVRSASADPLPNTKPLTTEGDLAKRMVDGIHKYLDRELEAATKRENAARPDRERLKYILGVVDPRVPTKLEYVGGPDKPSLLAEREGCKIHAVRWAVLNGIESEGLLIEPKGKPKANLIAIPHAGQSPEEVAGLAKGDDFGFRCAHYGCRVLIPTLIDRDDKYSGNARLGRRTNIPHREFIHRMAYEMGRTLTGYEVQKVLAAVDWFEKQDAKLKIGVVGYGEGRLIARYAGAIDERIAVTDVQQEIVRTFDPKLIDQPIDRNVWDLVSASRPFTADGYFAGRSLTGYNGALEPTWPGPRTGQGLFHAAPGKLVGIEADPGHPLRNDRKKFVEYNVFLPLLKLGPQPTIDLAPTEINLDHVEPRHKRQFDQLVAFTQNLWRHSEPVRKDYWKKADASSPEKWEQSCEPYRNHFHEEAIGKLPEPTMPLNPRSRPIYDTPKWTGHEIMLDVYDDVFAYGIVLLPKDLKPGEKRPVVVCQHGLEGRPTDVCDPKQRTKYYNSFAAQLADRGYIVFAPQNPYIFDNYFRQIMRKANPLKLSLFSFIIRQHQRIIDLLETQPNVDPKRIAFYGLSYGGKTAMRVPAVEKRYCLSICSGDFNEWIGKIVSTELPMSYMFTKEYDMLEFNLGHTYNYAEMANLIAPRPFMVERGHDDGVGIDEMIAYEFAKVRYLYENRLKIGDRTELEFFVGGHEIHGKGTFAFLDKHLKWTPK
ncbi:MAG: hypothetical protein KF873_04885 [Gemmataceae bacterium]|nr:hypothetical protein [Gemmataceae bacterium]